MSLHGFTERLTERLSNRRRQRDALRRDWRDVRWLAVDLETNGLDCGPEGILSMAWVPMHRGVMGTAAARYHVIRTDTALNQSAVHHHLTSAELAEGEALDAVMRELAEDMQGAVLVAHHAGLDWRLLRAAAKQTGIDLSPLAVVDTLRLEQQRSEQRYQFAQTGSRHSDGFTLSACRERHDLPPRPAHHALEDAVACGELFLAQAWKLAGTGAMAAQQLVRRSAGVL